MSALVYTPVYPGGWRDKPETSTPIDAAALAHIEAGITALVDAVNGDVPCQPTAPDHTVMPAWLDSTTSPPTLKGWNGSAWVVGGGYDGGVEF